MWSMRSSPTASLPPLQSINPEVETPQKSYTKSQVLAKVEQAKAQWLDGEEYVNRLIAEGYVLEGLNDGTNQNFEIERSQQQQPAQSQAPRLADKGIAGRVAWWALNAVTWAAKGLKEGVQSIGSDRIWGDIKHISLDEDRSYVQKTAQVFSELMLDYLVTEVWWWLVGWAVAGWYTWATTTNQQENHAEKAKQVIDKVSENEIVQWVGNWYNNLDPNAQREFDILLGQWEGALEIFWWAATKGISTATKNAVKKGVANVASKASSSKVWWAVWDAYNKAWAAAKNAYEQTKRTVWDAAEQTKYAAQDAARKVWGAKIPGTNKTVGDVASNFSRTEVDDPRVQKAKAAQATPDQPQVETPQWAATKDNFWEKNTAPYKKPTAEDLETPTAGNFWKDAEVQLWELDNIAKKVKSNPFQKVKKNIENRTASLATWIDADDIDFARQNKKIIDEVEAERITSETVASEIDAEIKGIKSGKGNIAGMYDELKGQDVEYKRQDIINSVTAKLWENGIKLWDNYKIDIDTTKYRLATGEEAKLQKMVNMVRDMPQRIDAAQAHVMRQNIDELTNYSDGINKKTSRAGQIMRGIIDEKLQEIPWWKDVDALYKQRLDVAKEFENQFYWKTKGELKEHVHNLVTWVAFNKNNKKKLDMLEELIPGISKKIRALKYKKWADKAVDSAWRNTIKAVFLWWVGTAITWSPVGALLWLAWSMPKGTVKLMSKLTKQDQSTISRLSKKSKLEAEEEKAIKKIREKLDLMREEKEFQKEVEEGLKKNPVAKEKKEPKKESKEKPKKPNPMKWETKKKVSPKDDFDNLLWETEGGKKREISDKRKETERILENIDKQKGVRKNEVKTVLDMIWADKFDDLTDQQVEDIRKVILWRTKGKDREKAVDRLTKDSKNPAKFQRELKGMKAEQEWYVWGKDAEKTIRKYFTADEVSVKHVETLSTPQGQKAFWMYHKEAITLVKNPKASTAEHEVAHAYFDMFKTVDEQVAILDEVKKAQNIKGDLEAEERLADAFYDYVSGKKTPAGKVKAYISNVWETMKRVFGKESKVKSFFKDIERGRRGEIQKGRGGKKYQQENYDYRLGHTAPMKDDYNKSIDDMTDFYPDDFYWPNWQRYYGDWWEYDKESMDVLKSVRGKPDAEITIYRSVPTKNKGVDINRGDWVSVSKKYVEDHGEGHLDGDYIVLEKKVPAKHIYTDGNSIHEQGYDPWEAKTSNKRQKLE